MTKTTQERLDAGSALLMKVIKQAEKGAAETCEVGDFDTSAKLHQLAGLCRQAYGIGRTIDMGGITAKSGGK